MYKLLSVLDLIGSTILNATINEERDAILLETEKEFFYLVWHGDCCAKCFLNHVGGVDNLIGSTVTDVRESEWKKLEDGNYEVIESMGTTLVTSKGYVDFETRLEHNGYYGGWINMYKKEDYDNYFKGHKFKSFSDF